VSVVANAPYQFPARDVVGNFPAPLLYIGWDQHMMFCAPLCVPVPGDTVFADVVHGLLPKLYGQHPDFARIAWPQVQWFRSATMFTPAMPRTLAEQGFKHKSVLRFRTPGLEGLRGCCG
jgi:phenol/toluene 2-monooxygenase (NADH) P4/A4